MAKIFVTRDIPGDALRRLSEEHNVRVWPGAAPPTVEELIDGGSDAEAMLTMLTDQIDAQVIAGCPHLRVIANYAVGTDNIDLDAARARGIVVGNTPDVLTPATADLTFALLLALARHICPAAQSVKQGKWKTWEPKGWLGADLSGATLGIIGFGRIGQAVAARAEGFSMNVIHHSRSSGVPLTDLLEQSHFVSLHCPLTPETEGLIDEIALDRMRSDALLINTARGPIIDHQALENGLRKGRIAGAALDVTDPEPLPADHPLLALDNVLVVPHIASATHRTRETMALMSAENVLAGLAGNPLPYPVS